MKLIPFCLIILLSSNVFSQNIHFDFYGGAAFYEGDLQSKRLNFNQAKPAVGLGLSYDITRKFIVRGAANFIKLTGKDEIKGDVKGTSFRNLSFNSNILEAQLALEYNIFDIEERGFTPYVFGGIAAFHFNPYSHDSSGNKVFLRALTTEGQGLTQYPDKKLYNNKQLAIPFGGGVKLALSSKIQAGLEIGLRKLFTDYLDDVSGSYADSTILAGARSSQAAAFAYRGSQIPGTLGYPAEGSQRGNPKFKDWYYTVGLKVSYMLNSTNGQKSKRSKTGCPQNVY